MMPNFSCLQRFHGGMGVTKSISLAFVLVMITPACSSNSGSKERTSDTGIVDLRPIQPNDTASGPTVTVDTGLGQVDSAPSIGSPDAAMFPKDTATAQRDTATPRLDAGRKDVAGAIGVPTANSWLFVVRSVEEPTPGEMALIEHSKKTGSPLVALAMRWFTNSEAEAKTATNFVVGRNGVIISNAASGNAVIATKAFQMMPVPVITLSERSYNFSGESAWLAPVTSATTNKGAGRQEGTQVTITGTNPELTAGLTGSVAVSSSAMSLGWGAPQSASAIIVATLPVPVGAAAIFAFPRGATLEDGTSAPGPRAGFFFDCIDGSTMTTDGWKLWDALLVWAATQ